MNVQQIPIDSVIVPEGRLSADMEQTVPDLVESICEVGLLHPITVKWGPSRNSAPTYILVAGRNRLEAARQLGWTEIEANVQEYDRRESEIAELTENLHRRTMSQSQRDRLIARYVKLCRTIDPPRTLDCKAEDDDGPPFDCPDEPPKLGSKCEAYSEVAKQTGLSETTVRRAVARATLSDQERADLEDAGLPLGDITAIASVKRRDERDRLIVLCRSGLTFQDAQIVLEMPDDEVAGVIVIQSTMPLKPDELIDVAWQDDVDRRAIISLLAASMPFVDAMREVLGERWANDPQADHNLSDADWVEQHCGELACYRNSDRDTFVRAVGTYRQLQNARVEFERAIGWPDQIREQIRQVEGAFDPYRARLVRFLSTNHPTRWVSCPGRVYRACYRGHTSQGTCERCQGAGFLIG